jgi:hypothetical protein
VGVETAHAGRYDTGDRTMTEYVTHYTAGQTVRYAAHGLTGVGTYVGRCLITGQHIVSVEDQTGGRIVRVTDEDGDPILDVMAAGPAVRTLLHASMVA